MRLMTVPAPRPRPLLMAAARLQQNMLVKRAPAAARRQWQGWRRAGSALEVLTRAARGVGSLDGVWGGMLVDQVFRGRLQCPSES